MEEDTRNEYVTTGHSDPVSLAQKALDLMEEIKAARDAAGRSEAGRLYAVATTEAEKLAAFLAYVAGRV